MAQPASKSIEELLAADDDLKFFDDVNGERCVTIVTKYWQYEMWCVTRSWLLITKN